MKKIISFIITVIMIMSTAQFVYALDAENAQLYALASLMTGTIEDGNEEDTYIFGLEYPSKVTLNLKSEVYCLEVDFADESGKSVWGFRTYGENEAKGVDTEEFVYLTKGKYHLTVSKGSGEGKYEFILNSSPVYESCNEEQNGSNNSVPDASSVNTGEENIGFIAINDDADIYMFNLPSSGKLGVEFSSEIESLGLKLYDEKAKQLWGTSPYADKTTKVMNFSEETNLNKGKYYFGVSRDKGEGEYSFKLNFTPANESFSEDQGGTNNKTSTANIVEMNQKYIGFIGTNDNVDMFRIKVDAPEITLNLTSEIHNLQLKLYDAKGKQKWNAHPYWDDSSKVMNFTENLTLASGEYIFSVAEGSGSGEFTFWFTDGGQVLGEKTTEDVITVTLKGKRLPFDQHPIIENGRTLVPLRVIFEALDAYVKWDGNTQTVIATKGNKTVTLQIGSANMYVNDTVKVLDVPAKLLNGRTLVPVRAVSEAFGCNVGWNADTKTVIID